MKLNTFDLVFLGIFILLLLMFSAIFLFFSSKNVADGSLTVLWSALIFLFLLFGIIAISLFLNRSKKGDYQ
jgi:hypothetical protein